MAVSHASSGVYTLVYQRFCFSCLVLKFNQPVTVSTGEQYYKCIYIKCTINVGCGINSASNALNSMRWSQMLFPGL